MIGEIKYCKFCNKEKPIEEFVKSGFAIKNICRECQNKKQTQIYKDSKKVKELEKENQELKKQLEVGKEQYDDLVEEKEKIKESYDSLVLKHEAQQKEFIEWLEQNIENEEYCYLAQNPGERCRKDVFEEALSKYKEIIGDKDE